MWKKSSPNEHSCQKHNLHNVLTMLIHNCSFGQVWDVKCGEGVANYRAHHGRLLSVMWSSLDPDVIYTGGDDFTIQAWNILQQTHKIPPAGKLHQMIKDVA